MNYNFDSIAGYETEKEELKRLCELFNNRQKYEERGAKLPKGIIFYGEAGSRMEISLNSPKMRLFGIFR